MAHPTPTERLQPCLLDRLTDDEPGRREESRTQAVVSLQKYRRGVLRDLEWLFNTNAYLSEEANGSLREGNREPFRLRDYPDAWRSVINFGVRQLTGRADPDLEKMREALAEAIAIFEPRITPRSLTIRANVDRQYLVFDIEGELWAKPMPEHLHLKTTVDSETGLCLLGDAPHG